MSLVKIACPHCGFNKEVEQARIPVGATTIKCPKCQQSFALAAPQAATPRPSVAQPSRSPLPNRGASSPTPPVRPRGNGETAAQAKYCTACGERLYSGAQICGECGARTTPAKAVSKGVLLLITFFFGQLGGHQFYVKRYLQGTFYLLFCWTGIPGLIAFVEFILFIFKDSEELKQEFPEVNSGAFVAIFAAIATIFIGGILAAIVVPQLAVYRDKLYGATVVRDMQKCNAEVVSIYNGSQALPVNGQLECQASPGVALYYFSRGAEGYQLVGFHDKGQKAYKYVSGASDVTESAKEEMEQKIEERYGSELLERTFHFVD